MFCQRARTSLIKMAAPSSSTISLNRFTGTDHNRTPAYLKAVNSGRRVRFADEVCGSLGTELDRTTYQDSTRLPDYAPPSIQTKIGLHSQDLDCRRPQDPCPARYERARIL